MSSSALFPLHLLDDCSLFFFFSVNSFTPVKNNTSLLSVLETIWSFPWSSSLPFGMVSCSLLFTSVLLEYRWCLCSLLVGHLLQISSRFSTSQYGWSADTFSSNSPIYFLCVSAYIHHVRSFPCNSKLNLTVISFLKCICSEHGHIP